MTRAQILDTAKDYVTRDRQNSYGEPEDTFGLIAKLWSAYLNGDGGPYREITNVDVAMLMTLLKVARQRGNPQHVDSYVDLAGYAACAGEIAGAG